MGGLVRAARVSDAAAIAAVSSAASPATYAELIQRQADLVFVAESDGSVVGYLALQHSAHPAVESRNPIQLWQLYVIPAFHGSGIAAQLMAAALEYARSHLHDVIWLGVSEHNARGMAFYRKHGFNPLGLHQVGAGNHAHDDILMSRSAS
ncbi:MAG: GNAT family N-acetyltransferase [Steroidobacteraceae bacterium]